MSGSRLRRERLGSRTWANDAVRRVEADANRSADTHLHPFPLPADWGIDVYLKDESVHPTGSLKHRLARSLFLYGLCNGWIGEGMTIVEASSGSTAVSEANYAQMTLERHPMPAWIVVGAGTGGTSATIGRYARFGRYPTRLCVVDPEDSIFYSAWTGDASAFTGRASRIEGIGRQRLEPSFLPDIVDRMIQVPDAASIATMRLVRERTGRSVGGSTGTNVWGAFVLVAEMLSRGDRGSIVTLICDGGDRYKGTYYSDAWVAEQRLDLAPYMDALRTFLAS